MKIETMDDLTVVMEKARRRAGLSYESVKKGTNSGKSQVLLEIVRGRQKDLKVFTSLVPALATLGLELHIVQAPSKTAQRRDLRTGINSSADQ